MSLCFVKIGSLDTNILLIFDPTFVYCFLLLSLRLDELTETLSGFGFAFRMLALFI